MQKKIVITGVTGQMGYFAAKHALENNMIVTGVIRYSANYEDKLKDRRDIVDHPNFNLEFGALEDQTSLDSIVYKASPDYFLNCAAMSHVGQSWITPEATCDITGIGVLRCLEAIKNNAIDCKFIQCSSSEMLGGHDSGTINEDSQLLAKSPYGAAKILGHLLIDVYRKSYGMWASSMIMFNYTSEKRGKSFFERKVTSQMAEIFDGKREEISLGNLMFERDWGYAGDYIKAIFMSFESAKADDYVVATGVTHSGKEFIDAAFSCANKILSDAGFDFEFSFDKHIVSDDPDFMRPNDLTYLCGDSSKIRNELGWTPEYDFDRIVKTLVFRDFNGEKNAEQ